MHFRTDCKMLRALVLSYQDYIYQEQVIILRLFLYELRSFRQRVVSPTTRSPTS